MLGWHHLAHEKSSTSSMLQLLIAVSPGVTHGVTQDVPQMLEVDLDIEARQLPGWAKHVLCPPVLGRERFLRQRDVTALEQCVTVVGRVLLCACF